MIGHLDIARELIRAGADVNRVDSKGVSALMSANCGPRRDIVKELINSGAILKGNRYSVNSYAGPDYGKQLDVVKELIKAGADVNALDKEGNSVLSYYVTIDGVIE